MQIIHVSEDVFKAIDTPRRLVESAHARVYYKLDFESTIGIYGIAYNSDLISPVIVSKNGNVWVGADTNLVVISSLSGRILSSFVLNTNISYIAFESNLAIGVCEYDVLLFNQDMSIHYIVNTPNVLGEMKRIGSSLFFSTIEGPTIEVKLSLLTARE